MGQIKLPIFVLLIGGFAGGGVSDMVRSSLGIKADSAECTDSIARSANAQLSRKLDTVAIRQDYMLDMLQEMREDIRNLHRAAE